MKCVAKFTDQNGLIENHWRCHVSFSVLAESQDSKWEGKRNGERDSKGSYEMERKK
jgi:hypothetical protein